MYVYYACHKSGSKFRVVISLTLCHKLDPNLHCVVKDYRTVCSSCMFYYFCYLLLAKFYNKVFFRP